MQRAAIFLTAVDGQTHDEVADALGISHGALRGLLYRARTTLRGAAAALTPSPLLAWASNGTGAAAPSAERLAELTAGGGAGFAGLLLKGAVVAVTAGALATGAGVVANHGRGASGRPRDAASAVPLTAPAGTHERRDAGGAASTVALVELRSSRHRHGESAAHGKRSEGVRAQRGERHGHGSRDGVVPGGREDFSPRRGGDEDRGSRGDGDEESAGRSDDRGGSSAGSGSTGDSSAGGSSPGRSSRGVSTGHEREQSPNSDRRSGSDGSQGAGDEAGEGAAAEVVQPAAPEAEQASGGQTSGEQTQDGGNGDSAGGSSRGESSRSDG
jgi:hypothetical protein